MKKYLFDIDGTITPSRKRIKHEFDFGVKKHTSFLTLVKDSLPEKLAGPNGQYEPKPKKSSTVISEKEILYPQL